MAADALKLLCALGAIEGDVIAFVGGGGKTTAMFQLAAEIVAAGGRVVTTTTTHIATSQAACAPVHVRTLSALQQALGAFEHVLLTGESDEVTGRTKGVAPAALCSLWLRPAYLLVEADGSRRLPFKAPAHYEPLIPDCATLVVAVVGIDVVGKRLTDEFVHRPELISSIHPGDCVTPEMVAAVLIDRRGARKNVPAGARFVPLINKVDTEERLLQARDIAALVLGRSETARVVIGAVSNRAHPVMEVLRR